MEPEKHFESVEQGINELANIISDAYALLEGELDYDDNVGLSREQWRKVSESMWSQLRSASIAVSNIKDLF